MSRLDDSDYDVSTPIVVTIGLICPNDASSSSKRMGSVPIHQAQYHHTTNSQQIDIHMNIDM